MSEPKTKEMDEWEKLSKDEALSILSFVFEVAKNAGFCLRSDEVSIMLLKDHEKTKKLLNQTYKQIKTLIQNQPKKDKEKSNVA